MTWQRATEIVAGRTYSWYEDGRFAFTPEHVLPSGDRFAFTYLDDKGIAVGDCAWEEFMPYEQAPVPPWIVRTEYRVPKGGERYIASWGRVNIAGEDWLDDEGPRVVLIIEPNPDYQAGDNG